MRILLFGGNGQLGKSIIEKIKDKNELIIYTNLKNDVNFCDFYEKENIINIIKKINPKIVINAVAYTDVERCEIYRDKARKINEVAVKILADTCRKIGTTLIHFSTDYVFDGNKKGNYTEEDLTNPINFYGISKRNGENNIINSGCNFMIIRLSWLYSFFNKKNFVMKIIDMIKEGLEIKITNNEVGSITSTDFVASKIQKILDFIKEEKKEIKEVFHLCAANPTNRFNIVQSIINSVVKDDNKKKLAIKNLHLIIENKNYNLAERPKNSKMSTIKFSKYFNEEILSWENDFNNFINKNNIDA